MNISIIIPNYNGAKLLLKNLPKVITAVKSYKKGAIEIIIPDDASKDNSVEVIEQFINSQTDKNIVVKTITNTNRRKGGFSANVNRGVSLATGEIVVLLNSDVIPYKDFLDSLIPHFKEPEVFAVGCMDESIEDGKVVLRGRGVGKWEKGFLIHSAGKLDKEETLWVSGGSGAFRKSIWDTLGGLYNVYNPFYWEDIDLSYRARKAGYLTLFEARSKVIHEHEEGSIKTQFKPFRIQKIVYRNQFFFVWLNATDTSLILSHLIWLPRHIVNAMRDRNWALIDGFFRACFYLPRIIQLRLENKKLFKKNDIEVIVKE